MTPEKNEIVLFFITDSEVVRQNLNIQGKICDCLIFYSRKGDSNKVLCLVELKGRKLEHAKEQIMNTYKQLRNLLEHSSCQNQLPQITWKAYICTHGDAPKEVAQCANELKKTFGKNNSSIA
ncbi:MAG TPA: hypothetical protein VEP90_15215, partial [Methylomirabilota bacterium]|nr:hypothetical protein [Methylomirabilota bacterium]